MGIVLLYASLSAYFVKIDDWYAQLVLPKIAASGQLMTIGWSLAYIVWCMAFFTFKSPLAGFIILIAQCVITVAIFIMLLRRDTISMILSQPLIAWYAYLAAVTYFIYVANM